MKKSRVFLGIAIIFVMLLGYVAYDFSLKTTFPGSKPAPKEANKKQKTDSTTIRQSLKM